MFDDFDTKLQCEEVYVSESEMSQMAEHNAQVDDLVLEMEVKMMLEII